MGKRNKVEYIKEVNISLLITLYSGVKGTNWSTFSDMAAAINR